VIGFTNLERRFLVKRLAALFHAPISGKYLPTED